MSVAGSSKLLWKSRIKLLILILFVHRKSPSIFLEVIARLTATFFPSDLTKAM